MFFLGLPKKVGANCRNVARCCVFNRKPGVVPGFCHLEGRDDTVKYAILVYQAEEHFDRGDSKAIMAAGKAYSEALRAAGIFVAGAGFEPPRAGATVSIREGKRQVHDGPYAETKEYLAGFGIIDVPDQDTALEWAARHHAAGFATIEVRPLLEGRFLLGPVKP
jgi:hypothetical protein